MADIRKGEVWNVEGISCRVKVDADPLNVSCEAVIPLELQGMIAPGDSVAFVQFEDGTALVINRTDGA